MFELFFFNSESFSLSRIGALHLMIYSFEFNSYLLVAELGRDCKITKCTDSKVNTSTDNVGLGLNKILFDGMLFKILKKMVCPGERDKKEENIQGPPLNNAKKINSTAK